MSILSFYQRGIQKLADAEKSVVSRLAGGLKGLGSAQNQITQQAAQSVQQVSRPTTGTTNVLTNAVKQVSSGVQSLPSAITSFRDRVQSGDIPQEYKATPFDILKSRANSAVRPFTQPLKPFVSPFQRIFNQPKIITIQGRDSQPSPITQFGRGLSSGINSTFKPLEKIFGAPPTPDEFKMSSQFAINKARGFPTTPEMEAANKKISDLTFNAVAGTVERPKAIADVLLNVGKSSIPKVLNGHVLSQQEDLMRITKNNIRIDKLGLPTKQAEQEIADVISRGNNFADQRRGVQTWADTEAAAQIELPKIINKIKKGGYKPGTTLNDYQLNALGKVTGGYQQAIDDVAKQIANGDNRTEKLLELEKLRLERYLSIQSLAGATAEAGRTMQSIRMLKKAMSPEILRDDKLMKQVFEKLGGEEKITKAARRLAELGDDELAKFKFVQQLSDKHWTEKMADFVDWYFYNSLLSGPKTQERNFTGNTVNYLYQNLVVDPVAGIADAGLSKFRKDKTRAIRFGEVRQKYKGAASGAVEGFQKARYMMKNGFTMDDFVNAEFSRATEIGTKIFGGKAAIPLNAVSRGMQAVDQFFGSIAASTELHGLAHTAAKNKGLKGQAYKKAVADFIADPPQSAIEQMREHGRRLTFQQENALSNKISPLTQNKRFAREGKTDIVIWNPAKTQLPFVKTPTNILQENAKNSPLGSIYWFANEFLRNDKRLASRDFAKTLIGTAGVFALWNLVKEGFITGNGPKDPEQRRAKEATGWRPTSFNIGGTYINYRSLPLAGTLMGITAMVEPEMYDGEEADISARGFNLINSITEQSFLEGVDAITKSFQYGDASRIWNNLAGSSVPFSALLKTAAVGKDPFARQINSPLDAIKEKIPGLRESLRPQLDAFGREVKYSGNTTMRMFDFLNISKNRTDRESQLAQEALRLGVTIQMPERKQKLTNLKTGEQILLGHEQKNQYAKNLGEMMSVTLDRAISSPEYQSLSDDEKRIYLEERIADAKKFIDGSFFIDSLSPDQKRELSIKVIDYSVAVPTETKDLEVFDPQSGSKIDLSPEDKSAYYERMWQGIYDTVTTGEQREEFQYLDPEQKKSFINSQVSNLKSFMKDGFTMFKNDEEGFFDGALRLKSKLDADDYLKNAMIDNLSKKIVEFKDSSDGSLKEYVMSDAMKPYVNKVVTPEDESRLKNNIIKIYKSRGANEYEQFLLGESSETRALYLLEEWKSIKNKDEKAQLINKLKGYEQSGIFDEAVQNKFIELVREDKKNQTTQEKIKEENDKSKKQLWPTQSKNITSTYGHRSGVSPAWHSGVDIGGQMGDPIYSSKAGTVVQVDSSPDGYGNSILVDHGNGIQTRYGHLSGFNVKVGDNVSQGDVIGSLGSTGNSTGPHLHYEVIQDGKQIDPMKYEEFSY